MFDSPIKLNQDTLPLEKIMRIIEAYFRGTLKRGIYGILGCLFRTKACLLLLAPWQVMPSLLIEIIGILFFTILTVWLIMYAANTTAPIAIGSRSKRSDSCFDAAASMPIHTKGMIEHSTIAL